MLKGTPASAAPLTDIQRFWEQTGNFYATGRGNDNLADPFIGLSFIPASTGVFRDMTGVRFEHPQWIPENCTACGSCYTVCPDSAIAGLVHSPLSVLETALKKIPQDLKFLPRAIRTVEQKLRAHLASAGNKSDIAALLNEAISETIGGYRDSERGAVEQEFDWLREALGGFKLAATQPYWFARERKQKSTGGLLSITVNPYACKGCMECVKVCNDDALRPVPQTSESVAQLRHNWDFWNALPTTSPEFIRIENLDEKIGALETLLLDKRNYLSMSGGDGACLGCGEKTVVHLFTATVEALMQPRVKAHVAKLDDLISRLDQHVRLKLAGTIDLTRGDRIEHALDELKNQDVTLASFSEKL